ncbi:MAG TPA: hypothetical protein DCL54_10215, partial [Alphaproteobacteria bacterium]|nr:hypothetical protein [Alphaproteobacteria bacterium]
MRVGLLERNRIPAIGIAVLSIGGAGIARVAACILQGDEMIADEHGLQPPPRVVTEVSGDQATLLADRALAGNFNQTCFCITLDRK